MTDETNPFVLLTTANEKAYEKYLTDLGTVTDIPTEEVIHKPEAELTQATWFSPIITETPQPPMAQDTECSIITNYKLDCHCHWDDYIGFTHDAMVSLLNNSEDIAAISIRLMSNQEDIGKMLAPHYGNINSKTLIDILREHARLVLEIFKLASLKQVISGTEILLDQNGKALSAFLESLDPTNWPEDVVGLIWNDHINATKQSLTARQQKEWSADIAAYDKNHLVINALSDVISNGIIAKFPTKFVEMP